MIYDANLDVRMMSCKRIRERRLDELDMEMLCFIFALHHTVLMSSSHILTVGRVAQNATSSVTVLNLKFTLGLNLGYQDM